MRTRPAHAAARRRRERCLTRRLLGRHRRAPRRLCQGDSSRRRRPRAAQASRATDSHRGITSWRRPGQVDAGDEAAAAAHFEDCLHLYRSAGSDLGIAATFALLGVFMRCVPGCWIAPWTFSYAESLAIAGSLEQTGMVRLATVTLARIALRRGELDIAASGFAAALDDFERDDGPGIKAGLGESSRRSGARARRRPQGRAPSRRGAAAT